MRKPSIYMYTHVYIYIHICSCMCMYTLYTDYCMYVTQELCNLETGKLWMHKNRCIPWAHRVVGGSKLHCREPAWPGSIGKGLRNPCNCTQYLHSGMLTNCTNIAATIAIASVIDNINSTLVLLAYN